MTTEFGDLDWPVLTDRLVLRPAVADDEEAILSYRREDETARWLSSWPLDRTVLRASLELAPSDHGVLRRRIRQALADNGFGGQLDTAVAALLASTDAP